jgi:hypothetical protein
MLIRGNVNMMMLLGFSGVGVSFAVLSTVRRIFGVVLFEWDEAGNLARIKQGRRVVHVESMNI